MTRLVNMLESSEDDIEISVERFRAPVGVSELGEQPFVSVMHPLIIIVVNNMTRKSVVVLLIHGYRTDLKL